MTISLGTFERREAVCTSYSPAPIPAPYASPPRLATSHIASAILGGRLLVLTDYIGYWDPDVAGLARTIADFKHRLGLVSKRS
jgi:hypothetical protein